ncbi:hypothetical protein [Methylobacterium planeticum]|uniref:Uncharacterized protein n=1 Tax=Methylobacterium planeticum TaxID=2615211 RepID=A0A6N6MNQ5_9HYPH|nr:hypothetical protein [Methylobacterium planeticum]KAB1071518.1 hypothetical protein F6X51_19600 [Methylobacterium planeticum]
MNTTRNRKAAPESPSLRQRAEALRSSLPRGAEAAPLPVPFATTVEAELIALNERYEEFQRVHDDLNCVSPTPANGKALNQAEAHSARLQRAILREAVGLPAASISALGLQARLIASVSGGWWDDDEIELPEQLCRQLLDRVLGLAGLSRIRRPDVTPDEIRGWLAEPATAPGTEERAK